MDKKVVVTGMGILSPLGRGIDVNWNGIIAGKSVIGPISYFDTETYPCKIAGQIPMGTEAGQFDIDSFMSVKERRHIDPFIIYGLAAADDALSDSGWKPQTEEEKERTGVLVGSGIGGMSTISDTIKTLKDSGVRRVSPFFIPSAIINMVSGQISIRHDLRGPSFSLVSACATGTHSIGEAARMIQAGDADVMLAGGSEAAVCDAAVAGFSQARALSTSYNDTPDKACRPFDKARDGFIMGEGAAVLVLEEYEHAKKRGAKIYAEVKGYAATCDAYHITAPGNKGGLRAMRNAIANAGLNPEDIGYINAHGTSTPTGDIVEISAVQEYFAGHLDTIAMSSTKSTVGHLLGAAGAVEAVYSILAMNKGILPPTVNLENPADEAKGLNLVPNTPQEKEVKAVLSNSFGFGGTNGSLVFGKI
ncbi:MAG: beta-ketoacyl-ACP synthase II [Alphaproteobacteria bacterium]|nr:beta-ketoacyl-ACP synthase II [Alphaproteobacteria bacterium]